jgi:hypothetical protein
MRTYVTLAAVFATLHAIAYYAHQANVAAAKLAAVETGAQQATGPDPFAAGFPICRGGLQKQ